MCPVVLIDTAVCGVPLFQVSCACRPVRLASLALTCSVISMIGRTRTVSLL